MKSPAASTRHSFAALLFAASVAALPVSQAFAANHREAPLTALDHKADITDWFAFVSYDDPTKVCLLYTSPGPREDQHRSASGEEVDHRDQGRNDHTPDRRCFPAHFL